jgi:hypothetical protein
MGGKSTKSTQKKKKKLGGRGGERIKFRKETEIRVEKGQRKNSTWDGTGIEKRNPSVHHPSTLVQWSVLVRSGSGRAVVKCC